MPERAARSCSDGSLVFVALRKRVLAMSVALFQGCVFRHDEANLDDAGEGGAHERVPKDRVDLRGRSPSDRLGHWWAAVPWWRS